MKSIKITKIYNGQFPILRIIGKKNNVGHYHHNNIIGDIYQIIDIPNGVGEDEILSSLNPEKLKREKSILKFSDI